MELREVSGERDFLSVHVYDDLDNVVERRRERLKRRESQRPRALVGGFNSDRACLQSQFFLSLSLSLSFKPGRASFFAHKHNPGFAAR